MPCPMRGTPEHEDMRNESDEVTDKLGALKGAPVYARQKIPGPRPTVGVIAEQVAIPKPIQEPVGLPTPAVPQVLVDLVSTVIEGIGEVPARATFKAADFAFLQKEVGLVRFKAAKGVARQSIGLQMAEEAVARATRAESQISPQKVATRQGVPQNRSRGFPYGIFLLPLLYEVLKLADLRAGPAHLPPPLRAISDELLKGKQLQDPNPAREFAEKAARKPSGGRVIPKGAGGARGGARHVNAATLLQGQILKAKRKLSPPRPTHGQNISGPNTRADPNL